MESALSSSTSVEALERNQSPKPEKIHYHYRREELLRLYESPLVEVPPNMPPLKEWYGEYEPPVIPVYNKPQTIGNSSSSRQDQRNGAAQGEGLMSAKSYSRREEGSSRTIDGQNRKVPFVLSCMEGN
ncbi:hypothetical protein BT69DRAFT_160561 [Atractiella rhizophila]|nr:hypothetical protein BT69DRAFT_160561 [Atractiella rhizophila]